jgi:hypothetical protein
MSPAIVLAIDHIAELEIEPVIGHTVGIMIGLMVTLSINL